MTLINKTLFLFLFALLFFALGGSTLLFSQQILQEIDENTHVVMVGEPINFQNLSQGANSFEWDFGDNTPFATQAEPTHTYDIPGTYEVFLTVSNERCAQVVTKKVVVYGEEALYSTLYPNPARDLTTIFFVNDYLGRVEISITDMAGKVLQKTILIKEGKTFSHEMNLTEYATGTYLVTLRMGTQFTTHKLLKE